MGELNTDLIIFISLIFTNYSSKKYSCSSGILLFYFFLSNWFVFWLATSFVFIIKSQHKIVFSQRQSHFFNYISSFGNSTFIQITIFAWIFLEPYVIVVSLNNISKKKKIFFLAEFLAKWIYRLLGGNHRFWKKIKFFNKKKMDTKYKRIVEEKIANVWSSELFITRKFGIWKTPFKIIWKVGR